MQEAWFELFVVRTSLTKDKIPGGLSELACLAFQTIWDPAGHDASSAGLHLNVMDHGPTRVFLSMGGLLADEAALHYAFDCKGAAGLKPCFLCSNIFNQDPDHVRDCVALDPSGFCQPVSCSKYELIKPMEQSTLKASRLLCTHATNMRAVALYIALACTAV